MVEEVRDLVRKGQAGLIGCESTIDEYEAVPAVGYQTSAQGTVGNVGQRRAAAAPQPA